MENDRVEIAPVPADEVVDPTGCGDAYRSGILYALANGLSLEAGARIGSMIASLKVRVPGPQGLEMSTDDFRAAYRKAYGEDY